MSVLVFGATGLVGRALAADAQVRALSRADADLENPAACAAAIREAMPSAIINAAAWTDVDGAEAAPDRAHRANAKAPEAMAKVAAELGLPFVHISTDYVFDGSGQGAWTEDDTPNPLNAYGASKLAGEAAVLAAYPSAIILRTAWNFAGQGTNFVSKLLAWAKTRDCLSIVSDQIGGPTPAKDIASTCLTLIAATGPGGIYHYAGTPEVSRADFARAVLNTAGLDTIVDEVTTDAFPTPATRPLNSRLDCRKIEATYGIARPDWRNALPGIVKELTAHE